MIAARDPVGITTLYQGWSSKRPGCTYFASELKALHDECDKIISFPPGHVYDSATGKTERYFQPTWWHGDEDDLKSIPTTPVDYKLVRETLEKAVKKRLMSEVPYGVLLSGGLDSSLIAAIAGRETDKVAAAQSKSHSRGRGGRGEAPVSQKTDGLVGVSDDVEDDDEETLTAWPRLHSFSIGLENSPDLLAARVAAEYLGTVHHEYTFTVQEGLDAVPDVIYHLETYDVTTVRASTPMYLLSRKIKAMGVKMVLSGEGSDEIFGGAFVLLLRGGKGRELMSFARLGYLYFHAAPSPAAFHQECIKRVKNLHTADCLRANKCVHVSRFLKRPQLTTRAGRRWPGDSKLASRSSTRSSSKSRSTSVPRIRRSARGLTKPRTPKVARSWRSTSSEKRSTSHQKAAYVPPPPSSLVALTTLRQPYLPDSILWRQKEQFSDGVGYSWIDGLKAHSASEISDAQLAGAATRYPLDTPETKEAYLIRQIFEGHFPTDAAAQTAVRWIPRAVSALSLGSGRGLIWREVGLGMRGGSEWEGGGDS